jgi:hypothetical protein
VTTKRIGDLNVGDRIVLEIEQTITDFRNGSQWLRLKETEGATCEFPRDVALNFSLGDNIEIANDDDAGGV